MLYVLTRLDELVDGDDSVSVPVHFLQNIFLRVMRVYSSFTHLIQNLTGRY